jgi:hypothetical protein
MEYQILHPEITYTDALAMFVGEQHAWDACLLYGVIRISNVDVRRWIGHNCHKDKWINIFYNFDDYIEILVAKNLISVHKPSNKKAVECGE